MVRETLEYGQIDQLGKDDLLLYKLLHNVQVLRAEHSLSIDYMHTLVASVLRHWEFMRRVDGYQAIHNWGLSYEFLVFRVAVYRPTDGNGSKIVINNNNVFLLEDLVRYSPFFRSFGINVPTISPRSDTSQALLDFRNSNPLLMSEYVDRFDIASLDIELVSELAQLYANISSESLEVLASCPNEATLTHTCNAKISSSMSYLEQALSSIYMLRKQPERLLLHREKEISKLFQNAFEEIQVIFMSANWYEQLPNVKEELESKIPALRTTDEIKQSTFSTIGSGQIKDDAESLLEIRELILSYIALFTWTVQEIGTSIKFPDEYRNIAEEYDGKLSNSGVLSKSRYRDILNMAINYQNDVTMLSDAIQIFQQVFIDLKRHIETSL